MVDEYRRRDPDPSVLASVALVDHVEYRVTYEEQCAKNRSHHNVDVSARNTPTEDVVADPPMLQECPICGGAVIYMSNQQVIE